MSEKEDNMNADSKESDSFATGKSNDKQQDSTACETEETGAGQKENDKMMEKMQEKDRLLEEQSDRLKRLQADFENFRRRTRQEKEELSAIVAQGLILELLPVVDNFERALASADTEDAKLLLDGVNMIYRQLSGVLEKAGLAPIEAAGASFDPQQHEAVMSVADEEQPDGVVLEELQKGYTVRGKVIRPSMVKVVNNS